MKLRILTFALILAGAAVAQRPIPNIDATTPEGRLLQQIGQTQEDAKKLALYEQFVSKAPRHEAIGWIYEQMQPAYLKAGQPDKTLEIGAKLLAMKPDDVEAAHRPMRSVRASGSRGRRH